MEINKIQEEIYNNINVWMSNNGFEEIIDSTLSQIIELHDLINLYKEEYDATRTIIMAAIVVLEQNGISRDNIKKIIPSSSEIIDDPSIYKKEYDYILKFINLRKEIENLKRTHPGSDDVRKIK